MSRNGRADRSVPQKNRTDGSQPRTSTSKPLSYGLMLVAGSLVGFGVLVILSALHHSAPMVQDIRAAAQTPAPPAAPSHVASSDHAAAPNQEVVEHHVAAAESNEPDSADLARVQTRKTFTDKFMSRFLSSDCDKNRHSETGVQFGVNSYSEFTGSKRARYIEGEYRFEADGFKLRGGPIRPNSGPRFLDGFPAGCRCAIAWPSRREGVARLEGRPGNGGENHAAVTCV